MRPSRYRRPLIFSAAVAGGALGIASLAAVVSPLLATSSPAHGASLRAAPAAALASARTGSTSASSEATASTANQLNGDRVRAAIGRLLRTNLGSHVRVVVGGTSGAAVFSYGSGTAIPASTTKLLTAAAALHALGAHHRFTTSVVDTGKTTSAGASVIVLRGGGDPLLTLNAFAGDDKKPPLAGLRQLARLTAAALHREGVTTARLEYDTSLFSTPVFAATWPQSYYSFQAPVTSLWSDEGTASGHPVKQPALRATKLFAQSLSGYGIQVMAIAHGKAPLTAPVLASVQSARLQQQQKFMLRWSDNAIAEVLAHHVGALAGNASFDGSAAAVEAALNDLGVPTDGLVLKDGSGLSRYDRISPDTLLAILQKARRPGSELAPIYAGLPTAGRTGTLGYRFKTKGDPARGVVRAKTGSLTGVNSLAGYTVDADGTPVVFVLMADKSRSDPAARLQLEKIATALTRCACG